MMRVLHLGEEVVVRLAENPTTGYRWQVGLSGNGQLEQLDDSFAAAGSGIGAAGQRTLRFVARRTGTVQLHAVSRRAWESAEQSGRQLSFQLSIE
jgi:inhibitor of cysteine peptidase